MEGGQKRAVDAKEEEMVLRAIGEGRSRVEGSAAHSKSEVMVRLRSVGGEVGRACEALWERRMLKKNKETINPEP